jgi:zinc D-Ala-D-Ala carboxypeptidase
MTKLTEHFVLSEFTDSQTAARQGINNVPPANSQERKNIQRTAEVMEDVRAILGHKPILISSGYRSPQVNAAVGGSKNSAHMSGLAADFSCPGAGSPPAICKKLEPHLKALGVDQLINEYPPNGWVHLGLAATHAGARCQCLTIDSKGTRSGFG